MRTSNKILIATFALFMGTLIYYDLALQREYLKGNYANPHLQYIALNYNSFDEVELKSATAVNIKLVQGPYNVMAHPECMDFVKLTREHNRLIVSAKFNDRYHSLNGDFTLLISCPKLTTFISGATYQVASNLVTDTAANNFDYAPTVISGFKGGTLNIRADHASNLVLENNQLDSLKAIIGIHEKSRSNLTIGKNNHFVYSNVQILHNSYLRINNSDSASFKFKLADSAMLLINGAAVKHNFKPY